MNPARPLIMPLLALLLPPLCGAAQGIPATINYQGRLTDNSPQQSPVNGSIYMRFAIHDAAAGGAPLWQEPAGGGVAVTVNGGVFSVQLGAIVPLPAAVFTGGADRWLEITLNPGAGNEEILAPRQKLSANGYAVQSGHAGAADSAATANSAATAASATMAADSQALGGVPASGWQQALDANCGGGNYLTGFAPDGTPACSIPSAQPPVPLALSGSASVPLLTVTQSGAAQAIKGEVAASGSSSVTAVWGQHLAGGYGGFFNTTGTGTGVYGATPAGNGVHGASASATASGVYGENSGGGYGVAGQTTGAAAAVLGTNNGSGAAIYGLNTGTGRAGYFSNTAAGNASPALTGTTSGTGDGVYGYSPANNGVLGRSASAIDAGLYGDNTGGGAGVIGVTTSATAAGVRAVNHGSYAAVWGVNDGAGNSAAGLFQAAGASGSAGYFAITAAANPYNALSVTTAGGGNAAYITSTSAASTANALFAQTAGSGSAGYLTVANPAAIPLQIWGASGQSAPLQRWSINGLGTAASIGPTGIFTGNGSALTGVNAASVANGVYTTGSYPDPAWITLLAGSKISGQVASAVNATNAANAGNADTVTNGVYTTGSYPDPAWIASLAGGKISGSVADSVALGGIPATGWQQALAANCPGGQYLAGFSQGGAPACGTPAAQPSVPLILSGADPGPILAVSNGSGGGAILGATRGGAAVTARSDDPSALPLVAQGASGQSVDLQQWRDSAGATLAAVNFAGVFSGNGSALNSLNPAALSSGTAAISISGNAATSSAVSNGVYTTGSYSDPAWLTALAGAKISGTVAAATNAAQLGGVAASSYQRTLSPASCPAGQYLSAIAAGGSATCAAPVALSEPLRVIRGAVASTGAISGGAGFTITHGGTGDYTVNFTTPFLTGSTPAVTFTAHHASLLVFAAAGLTSASSAKVRTYNAAGTLTDENFFFIAAGAP